MRNWRLRTKVIAVLIVPTLTALALGGFRVKADLDRADDFRHTVSQVDLARDVTTVVHELQKERTLAVARVASGTSGSPELTAQIARVEQAVTAANASADRLETNDEATRARYERGLQRLSALNALRNAADTTDYPDVSVFAAYSSVLDSLVQLGREVNTAGTDRELLRQGTVIQALSEAKEFVGRENSIMQIAVAPLRNSFPADLLNQARGAQASASAALAGYAANASPTQQQLYSDTVSGAEVDNRERLKATAFSRAEAGQDLNFTDAELQSLTDDGFTAVERMRAVETNLLDKLRADAADLASAATTSAWRNAGIVLIALLAALLLMLVVTRSLLKPLRVLRRDALDVANRRLPATVQRILADPDPVEAAKTAVDPVPVFTREETGQLARSFDAVHDQAVRMATEQAMLRDNINSIFVNLSRRSQALVERQLSLIDRLEQDEQDPDQLASLFELDHLATRMRRNSESLLVLSGSGLSRQLNRPVPASEVVGAAVSEVEHYARIEVVSAPEVTVQGRAVSDLVHLIAELLDNATFFSEPEKKVIVRMAATRKRELAIQITDSGVGMSENEIEAANERLADPPDLDVAVTRRMGLYVVARLAKKHNIKVRLRDNEDIEGGLIARITVPAELVAPVGAPPQPPPPSIHDTASSASRASGIAGAFTGNMPRLRSDGGLVGESQVDRPVREVAGYPPFTTGFERTSVPPADQGGWASEATQVVGEAPPAPPNGQADEQGTVALFGNPLPDPGAPPADQQTDPTAQGSGYQGTSYVPVTPRGGATGADGTSHKEVDLNVDAPTERLPIYEAVLSQWFEAADTGSRRPSADPGVSESADMADVPVAVDNGEPINGASTAEESEPVSWVSPGDDGWLAAQALLDNTGEDVLTNAGLPKRVPKAHLVPGSAAPRPQPEEQPAPPPLPPRSADAVRGRMSSFQQGVRRGRHALIDAYAGDQSSSGDSRQDEEQE